MGKFKEMMIEQMDYEKLLKEIYTDLSHIDTSHDDEVESQIHEIEEKIRKAIERMAA